MELGRGSCSNAVRSTVMSGRVEVRADLRDAEQVFSLIKKALSIKELMDSAVFDDMRSRVAMFVTEEEERLLVDHFMRYQRLSITKDDSYMSGMLTLCGVPLVVLTPEKMEKLSKVRGPQR